jgi:hypothetical protein
MICISYISTHKLGESPTEAGDHMAPSHISSWVWHHPNMGTGQDSTLKQWTFRTTIPYHLFFFENLNLTGYFYPTKSAIWIIWITQNNSQKYWGWFDPSWWMVDSYPAKMSKNSPPIPLAPIPTWQGWGRRRRRPTSVVNPQRSLAEKNGTVVWCGKMMINIDKPWSFGVFPEIVRHTMLYITSVCTKSGNGTIWNKGSCWTGWMLDDHQEACKHYLGIEMNILK